MTFLSDCLWPYSDDQLNFKVEQDGEDEDEEKGVIEVAVTAPVQPSPDEVVRNRGSAPLRWQPCSLWLGVALGFGRLRLVGGWGGWWSGGGLWAGWLRLGAGIGVGGWVVGDGLGGAWGGGGGC